MPWTLKERTERGKGVAGVKEVPRGGALGQRDPAGAAAAGARGVEDRESRSALSRAGEPPPARTFPITGAESSREGSRARGGGAGLSAGGLWRTDAQDTPTPSKLCRGGVGGGGAGQKAAAAA